MKTYLITGRAGFLGSYFLKLFVPHYPKHKFINLDKLFYASNLLNLKDIENFLNYKRQRDYMYNCI